MSKVRPGETMASIQKKLKAGGVIEFAKGEYQITQTLYIYSKSDIRCEEGAVFYKKCVPAMFMTYVTSATTKYGGVHDVTFTGGRLVGANKSSTQSNHMTLCHAKNITIKNVVFQGGNNPHHLEINSSKNVKVIGCTFKEHAPIKDYKECVQIDYANYAGLTYASANDPTYDGTHCQDIVIEECRFFDNPHCIGTHTCTTELKSHKNITISECKAEHVSVFAKFVNMENVVACNNRISAADIVFYFPLKKKGVKPHGGEESIVPKACKNVRIADNEMEYCIQEVSVQ